LKLITKEIIDRTPALYKTDNIPAEEKVVTAKFFSGSFTWYMVEYDPDEKLAFGYVQNDTSPLDSEWGYFSIREFEKHNSSRSFPLIERDLYFEPIKFKDLKLDH